MRRAETTIYSRDEYNVAEELQRLTYEVESYDEYIEDAVTRSLRAQAIRQLESITSRTL